MRHALRVFVLAPGLLVFLGCLGMCGGSIEGANPGECSDGADNDEDGDYDCDDPDCIGSPDCQEEGDTDTDSDADSDTDADGDTDTGWSALGLRIDLVEYGFDSSAWSYLVELDGWGDEVIMTISQDTSSPWEEFHQFANTDYDPGGEWDLWELELPIVYSWSDQEESINTLFQGSHEGTMVWRIEAWNGEEEDCVVWAGDSADVGVLMQSGCREIGF